MKMDMQLNRCRATFLVIQPLLAQSGGWEPGHMPKAGTFEDLCLDNPGRSLPLIEIEMSGYERRDTLKPSFYAYP